LPTEFKFDESPVRAVMKDGEPWFLVKDVCDILEHSNHRMAVANLDDDEKGVSIIDSLGGPQETTIINESGLCLHKPKA
jgi:prophage antirepressor-like protein